ncbi:MAG: HAMP domain-containing sensor histidine kinase [Kofleriaceae bacterium]
MKLRSRIAVTTLLIAGPVLVLVVWLRTRGFEEAESEVTIRAVTEYMTRGGRAECERAPATWQEHPERPVPLPLGRDGDQHIAYTLPPAARPHLQHIGSFAYDKHLVPASREAPQIREELREQLARASIAIHRTTDEPPLLEVLVRMPWPDGPCAVVLVRRPDFRPDDSLLALVPIRIWAPVLLIVLVAVVFGVGPAVRRLRLLAREVRAAARAGYDTQVGVRGGDEIADLALAFNDAGREIRGRMEAQERRERTLREFLDNTTHDVMTPLTVLQGHLAGLAQRASPDQLARIALAMDEAHYMAALLHHLALAAKLEAGEPSVAHDPLELDALIVRVVARHVPIARNHGIALDHATPEVPLIVNGDVTLVEQGVSNLVLNAVQHGVRGGHVAVALDREGDRFRIRIVDDNPGVSDDDLAKLVERGTRGNDARTRSPAGRGLGLDIAYRVVHRQAWTLVLARNQPHGLCFTISGPLAP